MNTNAQSTPMPAGRFNGLDWTSLDQQTLFCRIPRDLRPTVEAYCQRGRFLKPKYEFCKILVPRQSLGLYPIGLSVDRVTQNIVVSDIDSHSITVFDPKGTQLHSFKGNSTPERPNGELKNPWGVSWTNQGNIVVADARAYRLQLFSPEGHFLQEIGSGQGKNPGCINSPTGVTVDRHDNFLALSDGDSTLQVFSPEGKHLRYIGKGRSTGEPSPSFSSPTDVAVDLAGNILVCDHANTVQKFDPEGTRLFCIGPKQSDEDSLLFSLKGFHYPYGIDVDDSGNFVVADTSISSSCCVRLTVLDHDWIQCFDPQGELLFCLGKDTPHFSNDVLKPTGIALDYEGNILISSKDNGIQMFY